MSEVADDPPLRRSHGSPALRSGWMTVTQVRRRGRPLRVTELQDLHAGPDPDSIDLERAPRARNTAVETSDGACRASGPGGCHDPAFPVYASTCRRSTSHDITEVVPQGTGADPCSPGRRELLGDRSPFDRRTPAPPSGSASRPSAAYCRTVRRISAPERVNRHVRECDSWHGAVFTPGLPFPGSRVPRSSQEGCGQ
jgi:hypothetical protein